MFGFFSLSSLTSSIFHYFCIFADFLTVSQKLQFFIYLHVFAMQNFFAAKNGLEKFFFGAETWNVLLVFWFMVSFRVSFSLMMNSKNWVGTWSFHSGFKGISELFAILFKCTDLCYYSTTNFMEKALWNSNYKLPIIKIVPNIILYFIRKSLQQHPTQNWNETTLLV